MDPHTLIPQITIRNLSDRLYEKRKIGAGEMEGIVSAMVAAKVTSDKNNELSRLYVFGIENPLFSFVILYTYTLSTCISL